MHTDLLSPAIRPPRDHQVRCTPHQEPIEQTDSAEKRLNQQFPQIHTAIDRVTHAMKAAHIRGLPLDHIGNAQFDHVSSRKQEAEILGRLQESDLPTKKPQLPVDTPAYVASLYEVPLLTQEQEVYLFRKMNYLKHKASALRARSALGRPKRGWMDRVERLYNESVAIKNQIITANLRLVISIAKRHVGPAGDLFELVSDGNVSLIKAVQKFDFARGFRFSTYASWAIMKNFGQTIPNAYRDRGRFCTGCPETFNALADTRPAPHEDESAQTQRESDVERLLDRLDRRERQIVTSRFGLTRGQEPLRLRQIGAEIGVSKERVRQIQCRALVKLRKAAEEDGVEDPQ